MPPFDEQRTTEVPSEDTDTKWLRGLVIAALAIFALTIGYVFLYQGGYGDRIGASVPMSTSECQASYGPAVDAVVQNYLASGWNADAAVYFSDTFGFCVGILIAESGNQTEVLVFDAFTGDALDPASTAVAIDEYSSL